MQRGSLNVVHLYTDTCSLPQPNNLLMHGKIIRKDLLEVLDQSHTRPLTLIIAPAGSGKTSLLEQWCEHQPAPTIAMLRLTARDDEPAAFFRHLLETLRQATRLVDVSTFDLFENGTDVPAHAIADLLLRALETIEERVCMVLDDFQHIQCPLIHRVIAILLDGLPSSLSLVIASRCAPQFSISQLQLENRLLLLDGASLRLTRGLIVDVNRELGGSDLSERQVERLHSLTEGWVAGVKLALLAYARSGQAALDAFSGSQPEMIDYFGHVVLEGLCVRTRQFLVHSAIFDRFNADLCDAVFQSSGSARIIETLLGQSSFITLLEDPPGWCRYHGLLQDFLGGRLAVEARPEEIEALHFRAAEFFLQAEDLEMALYHGRQCNNPEYFLATLQHACDGWARRGDFDAILRWLGPLAEDELLARISLAVPMLHALIFSRRFNLARYYLDRIKARVQVSPVWKHTSLGVLELSLQLFEKETDFFSSLDADPLMGASCHTDVRAFSLVLLAYYLMQHGDLPAALRTGHQAKAVLAQTGYVFLESYADLIIALCDRHMGRGHDAIAAIEKAYSQASDDPSTRAWVNTATAMVVVHYEQNRRSEAIELCQQLLPRVTHACATEVIATVYLSLARLLHLEGSQRQSTRLLDQLNRILLLGRYERFQSQVAQETMRQAVAPRSGTIDIEAIERLAKTYRLEEMVEAGYWQINDRYQESAERYGLTAAYWLTARGDYEAADQILAQVHEVLHRHDIRARAVVAACNRAQLCFTQGNRHEALSMLQQLIAENGLGCFSRSLFDETPGLERLFQFARDKDALNVPGLYEKFADLLTPIRYHDPDIAQKPAFIRDISAKENFTQKEREILNLLLKGMSNSAISEETGAALSTTKWHVKNIYQKLGVTSRAAAIVQARYITG